MCSKTQHSHKVLDTHKSIDSGEP